ncbi:MAG: radical SAM protein [Thermoplasmata archaeon]|nr:radical SAM protein [Thermoplasmata archaeon]
MLITLLDGYTDEPSRLGVPPFLAPYPRYVAGAVKASGNEVEYITIDQWRQGKRASSIFLFIIANANVPGKYLRGMPASEREVSEIRKNFNGEVHVWSSLAGKGDPDAMIYDMLASGTSTPRKRTAEEWREWSLSGADIIDQHPDFPQPLMLEIDMSFGCPRYVSGGCSFCPEMNYGEPVFRPSRDILDEMKELLKLGAVNFRLGGQSCLFTYMTEELGEDAPRPNIGALKGLFKSLARLDGVKVLHTDNANPGIMASHPTESREILEGLVRVCTGGNLLSMGIESADPAVVEANNLNASPEQVMDAIKMVNAVGAERAENGMPRLLPGLNFVAGLDGELKGTYDHNFFFLKDVLDAGLMLRRINIRQVASARRDFAPNRLKKNFIMFKKRVREEIDAPMLERVIPTGTVLRDVYMELDRGKRSFGRQVGTYPILVGLPYQTGLENFSDLVIISHGQRSITGIQYPFNINKASMQALASLPGIGKKRAARIIRSRPFKSEKELAAALDEPQLVEDMNFVKLKFD